MVTRLLRHLVWRNRLSYLPWPCLMYMGWTEVARFGGDVTLLMASSMAVAILQGSQAAWGLDFREIRVLPITPRDRWVTTWLLSTLVVTSFLFVVKSVILTLAVVIEDTVLMTPETLLLSTIYDFAYAGAVLPAGTLLGSAEHSRATPRGHLARPAWYMLAALWPIGSLGLPFLSARALPAHVSEFTIGHVLVLLFGLSVSFIGLRWTPRAFGSLIYHVSTRPTTPARPVARRIFGDRFTGVARIAWRHATKTFILACAGIATAVVVGAFVPLPKGFPRFLSSMFLLVAFLGISMVSAWAPWARRLRVLPLSVTHVNALFLITPLLTWVEVWIVLLLAHAALGLPIGEELGPRAVLAYGGVCALTNALVFKVYGSLGGQLGVFMLLVTAPMLVLTLFEIPHEWVRFLLLLVGPVSLAVAAFVNHRTLTRSMSGSLAYQTPS